MINFTKDELNNINTIIEKYHNVNIEYENYKTQLDSILEKIKLVENKLKDYKQEEDKLMKELHKKYGKFSIQDVYNSLNYNSNER